MWVLRIEPMVIKRAMGIYLGHDRDSGYLSFQITVLSSQDANLWILVVLICALCYAIENVLSL